MGRSDLVPVSRKIDGSRYSSARACVVVSALRIMPLLIGISSLHPFDLAIRITHQNGLVKTKLADSSFTKDFLSVYAFSGRDLTMV